MATNGQSGNKAKQSSAGRPGKKGGAANTKAAAKVRAAQVQQRQRMQWTVGIVVLIVAGIAVLVLAKMSTNDSTSKAGSERAKAPASLVSNVAKVPLANIVSAHKSRLKSDSSFKDLAPIEAPALTTAGKPEILYVGAEYCPFCAGERWAMAVALSKFGTLTDLSTTQSSATDQPASVPTISFHGATYTSKYINFVGRETETNTMVNGKYPTLDKLTSAEQKLVAKYDYPPYVSGNGGIPFILFGGKFVQSGASYDPSILLGKTHTAIASQLDGSGAISTAVNSTAGSFIKAICTLTKGQPGDVCKPFTAS